MSQTLKEKIVRETKLVIACLGAGVIFAIPVYWKLNKEEIEREKFREGRLTGIVLEEKPVVKSTSASGILGPDLYRVKIKAKDGEVYNLKIYGDEAKKADKLNNAGQQFMYPKE